MKITIEFNLPDEKSDYAICNNAQEYYESLNSIYNHIRSVRKGHISYSDVFDLAEAIAELIPYKALDDVL